MILQDLINTFRKPRIVNLAIIDMTKYICVAPADSVVLDSYLHRKIAFVDVFKEPKQGTYDVNLIVTLDVNDDKVNEIAKCKDGADRVCPAADI